MHQVLISIGSNNVQSAHIHWASGRLSFLLRKIRFSRLMWTPDIKGTGRLYMNRLATGVTELTAEEIINRLKEVEDETGRSKERVTIDLDLLQYDQNRYHLRDWSRPYVTELIDKWE